METAAHLFSQMGQITAKTLAPKNYHACHACDLLVYNTDVSPGEKAICPRCGTVIEAPKRNTLDRTLVLVLSGLVLFIPAVCLPVLSMTILGKTSYNTRGLQGAMIFKSLSGVFINNV
jgi:uncharacterized paraquat-inducible protein A